MRGLPYHDTEPLHTHPRSVAFLPRTRQAQPRFALSHQTREIHVVLRLMLRFGKISDHTGEGGAL